MKAFLLLLIVALSHLAMPSVASPPRSIVAETEKAMIALRANGPDGPIFCSAVAVSERLVQTQEHCVVAAKERGAVVWMENQGVASFCLFDRVVANDGRDNVLIHTACRVWPNYVERATNIVPYMPVFQFGYPKGMFLAYREGVLAGRYFTTEPNLPQAEALMFDTNGYGGDSGGGFFTEKGELICTTSFIYNPPYSPFRWMGCYPQRFKMVYLGKELLNG